MHSIEGHMSYPSFMYRTDETFKDIRRKKIKGKKVSSFYTKYNFAVELIATGYHYTEELTMDISVDIKSRAFMSDNNKLLEGIVNFVLQGSHKVLKS